MVLGLVRRSPSLVIAGVGGWTLWSLFRVPHNLPLPRPLPGDAAELDDPSIGSVAVHTRKDGDQPVLLVHGVGVAGSAYDLRPLFVSLPSDRRVFAIELPGFGHSQRGNRRYTPELMAGAITTVVERVIGQPTDVVALGLGCEFAARAALDRPDLIRSLVLLSPTGLGRERRRPGRGVPWPLRFPVLGQAVYDLLAIRPAIRMQLDRGFAGDADAGLVSYSYLTSHRPGARFAPLAFLTGGLFTPNAQETIYERVSQPTLVLYDRDPNTSMASLPEVTSRRSNWTANRIDGTCGFPQFEQTAATVEAINQFWKELAS